MKKQYQEDKANIKDAMKAAKLTVTSTWTLDKFKATIGEVYNLAAASETNLKLVFEEVLEQAKEKEEKEAKKRERLADDFMVLLYSVKEIAASSKWEDCIPLLKDAQAYKAISDESFCREIFDEYIAHLQEKVKERKRKRDEEKVDPPHVAAPDVPDMGTIFHYTNTEINRLKSTLQTSNGVHKDTCTTILTSLEQLRDRLCNHTSYTSEIVEEIFRRLREEISGDVSFDEVQRCVSKEVIKREVFPHYDGKATVKAYQVTRCTDPTIASLIYPRFLAAHGRYPNNDQIPLYFAQQLYAEVRLGLNVNYLDLPSYVGQGRGRLADRDQYRRGDRAAPAHRHLVGQRFASITPSLAPIANRVVIASQREAIDRIGDIASATSSISSGRMGRYIMSRPRPTASSGTSFDDPYTVAGIPTPQDLGAISGGDRQVEMCCYLLEDLLHAYYYISSRQQIPLHEVRQEVLRELQDAVPPSQTSRHSHHSVQHDPPVNHSVGTQDEIQSEKVHIISEDPKSFEEHSTSLSSEIYSPLHSSSLDRVRDRDVKHAAAVVDMMAEEDPLAPDTQHGVEACV